MFSAWKKRDNVQPEGSAFSPSLKKWWQIEELPEDEEPKESKLMHTVWKDDWWHILTIPDDLQISKRIPLTKKQTIKDSINVLKTEIRTKNAYQKYINNLQDDLSDDLVDSKLSINLKPETYIFVGKYIILSLVAIVVLANSSLTTSFSYERQTDGKDLNTKLEKYNLGFSLTFFAFVALLGSIAIFFDLLNLFVNESKNRNKLLGEQHYKFMQRLNTVKYELERKEYIIEQLQGEIYEKIREITEEETKGMEILENNIDREKIKKYIAKTLDQTEGISSYEKIYTALNPEEVKEKFAEQLSKGKEKNNVSLSVAMHSNTLQYYELIKKQILLRYATSELIDSLKENDPLILANKAHVRLFKQGVGRFFITNKKDPGFLLKHKESLVGDIFPKEIADKFPEDSEAIKQEKFLEPNEVGSCLNKLMVK